jgi:hypothetical protein
MKTPRTLLVAAAVLALSPIAGRADTPTGLLATIEQFDRLTVGNAVTVGSMTVATGHLECKLSSGRAAPVLAGDAVVGFFFEGNGEMQYLSVDAIEAPVVTFNARKGSDLKPEKTDKGVRLRDRFTRMLWVTQGQPLPALTGADAAPLSSSLAAQREKFGRLRGAPLSYDFAIQRLDAPALPLIRVEMDGGTEDLVYRRSDLGNNWEALSVLRPSESDDPELRRYLYLTTLSDQPVGRDRRDPPTPRVVLSDVDLDLRASAGKDASMTVVETLVPIGRPLTVLRLNLDSTVYTYVGRNLAKRSERLRKVTDEAGRSLTFVHGHDQALIQLAEPAAPERPVKLKFEIDGDFLVSPAGHSYWELGIWDWFPQPSLAGQLYTFHATVTVKKPFIPFAPGKTIRRAVEGDENVVETRVDKPICFAVILAGDYTVQEEVKDGVTIRVATYALENDRAVKQLTNLAASIIQYYQEFLGPFPLPEFNIIEINDVGWGQAPPGTMFITKEAFNPIMAAHSEDEIDSRGINEVFAHEIAHQYWGTAVKMPSIEEQWLTESFAEYCAALFLKVYKNEATYKSMVKHWRGRATFGSEKIPIPLASDAYVASDARTRYFIRNGLLYNKGPALLYALHKELGDEAFFTFLKSYQKSFAWKFGSTKMVAGLLQYMTNKDYMPFFEKYYWGTEMPKN